MPVKQKRHQKYHIHIKTLALWIIGIAVTGSLYMSDHGSFLYRTSIVSLPQHAAFDGTTTPIKKVPNWTKIAGSDKYTAPYSALSESDLMNIPTYDPNQLATSTDSLVWGNASDNIIRNAKITYSTPYMGSYLLNGKEYDGSNLAIDIKIPMNTPVYAIANGVISKASTLTTGFGAGGVVTIVFAACCCACASCCISNSCLCCSDNFIAFIVSICFCTLI